MSAGLSLDERMALREPLPSDLSEAAARLYPQSQYLQAEWQRAVCVVRASPRGWLLDTRVSKQERRRA